MRSSQKVKVPLAMLPLLLGFGLLLTGALLLFVSYGPGMDSTAPGSISEFHQGMSSNHVARCSYDAKFTVDGQTYVASSLDSSASNCDLPMGAPVVVPWRPWVVMASRGCDAVLPEFVV